ncbi:MAG: hypothetical protein MAG458_01575 [Nitrosopumilus sp.]|nr:hypothetical protein [Nitrosopumilus sp.]
MKTRLLIIAGIVIIAIIIVTIIIPAYLYRQSNDLMTINYVCATGLKPNAFSAYKIFDNGTHTIDMDSCGWIPNNLRNTSSGEYQDLAKMTCDEIKIRSESDIPYKNKENRLFAEHRLSLCAFVDQIEK